MRSYDQDNKKKNIGGKKSWGKGAGKLSTDAQSIAARERRHRISERFKILQSLVPGGTKMDTVSMLEEAINYVKFLKTQITWLHQNTMININFEPHPHTTNAYFLMQNYNFPPTAADQYQIQITTTAQQPNVATETDVLLPPLTAFPLQSAAYYSSYDQEILMPMPFDSNVSY